MSIKTFQQLTSYEMYSRIPKVVKASLLFIEGWDEPADFPRWAAVRRRELYDELRLQVHSDYRRKVAQQSGKTMLTHFPDQRPYNLPTQGCQWVWFGLYNNATFKSDSQHNRRFRCHPIVQKSKSVRRILHNAIMAPCLLIDDMTGEEQLHKFELAPKKHLHRFPGIAESDVNPYRAWAGCYGYNWSRHTDYRHKLDMMRYVLGYEPPMSAGAQKKDRKRYEEILKKFWPEEGSPVTQDMLYSGLKDELPNRQLFDEAYGRLKEMNYQYEVGEEFTDESEFEWKD